MKVLIFISTLLFTFLLGMLGTTAFAEPEMRVTPNAITPKAGIKPMDETALRKRDWKVLYKNKIDKDKARLLKLKTKFSADDKRIKEINRLEQTHNGLSDRLDRIDHDADADADKEKTKIMRTYQEINNEIERFE